MIDLKKDVKYVKGVGPNRVQLLNKLGIFTLEDLITYYPRTYEDRSKPKSLLECVDGEEVLIEVIAISKMIESKFPVGVDVVRSEEYVADECKKLAEQLKEFERNEENAD